MPAFYQKNKLQTDVGDRGYDKLYYLVRCSNVKNALPLDKLEFTNLNSQIISNIKLIYNIRYVKI